MCTDNSGIMADTIEIEGILEEGEQAFMAAMAAESIHAGFPSPAQDYMNRCIDLNRELVRHPASTFYGRVVGDSMIEAGVEEGDILVIDKSITPSEGDMAVCFLDGEFALKRVSFSDPAGSSEKGLWLIPANPKYSPIRVSEEENFTVWGVVTYVIKKTWRR